MRICLLRLARSGLPGPALSIPIPHLPRGCRGRDTSLPVSSSCPRSAQPGRVLVKIVPEDSLSGPGGRAGLHSAEEHSATT